MKIAMALAAALSVSAANAIELIDYINPTSKYEAAYLSGALNANSSSGDAQAQYNATLQANYERRLSALPRSWQVEVDASGSTRRDSTTDAQRVSDHDVSIQASIDSYFANDRARFWTAGTSVESVGGSDATDSDVASVTVGVGMGRIFDATPLARVLRVVEELQRFDLLSTPIADDLLLELAKVVAREDDYRVKYQGTAFDGSGNEHQAYMVADIERILQRESLLADASLGAVGALRVSEVLFNESVSSRKHGFLIRAGLATTRSQVEGQEASNEPAVSVDLEYAKPYGFRGQLSNSLRLLPSTDHTRLSNTLSYTYEVSDTVDWENAWAWRTNITDDATEHVHTLRSNYLIEVSDALTYTVGLKMTNRSGSAASVESLDGADTELTMSLRYRLR